MKEPPRKSTKILLVWLPAEQEKKHVIHTKKRIKQRKNTRDQDTKEKENGQETIKHDSYENWR